MLYHTPTGPRKKKQSAPLYTKTKRLLTGWTYNAQGGKTKQGEKRACLREGGKGMIRRGEKHPDKASEKQGGLKKKVGQRISGRKPAMKVRRP